MRFVVTAPDGRKITLSGDKEPTTADLDAIFGNMQQPTFTPDAEALEQIKANNAAYADKSHSEGVGMAALEGTIKGITSGAGRIASGATLGATDWIDRKTGGHLAAINDEIQQDANNAGVGGRLKVAQFGNELLGNIGGAGGAIAKGATKLGLKGMRGLIAGGATEGAAYGATSSDSIEDLPLNVGLGTVIGGAMPLGVNYGLKGAGYAIRPVSNKIQKSLGLRDLVNQLTRGKDFTDIKLGNVSDDMATRLNKVRNMENVSPVESGRLTIPADRVEHIYQKRITDNGYTPEQVNNVIDLALYRKNSIVGKGNEPQLQIIYDNSNPANKVVVGKHRDTGDIFIKTAMEDSSLPKKIRSLGGRSDSPYTADLDKTRSAVERISAFQASNDNVSQISNNVNSKYGLRSFVEALADETKRRKMRNAVLAGADDLSERAHILSDALEHRKNGMYDAELENLLKTPELRRAEEGYAKFMNKHGNELLSAEKVDDFYKQHPIAQDMIDDMRAVDPRAFDGVERGSLKEFDMLKQALRHDAGKNITVGASKKGALKRAENDLKTLMDDEFTGFKDVNKNFAQAQTEQNIFESRIQKGLTSVGGTTAVTSPFWSGISSPLAAAGLVGGYFNPAALAATIAGLGGKAIMRASRRNIGRNIANGVVKTPVNVNPAYSLGVTANILRNGLDYKENQ